MRTTYLLSLLILLFNCEDTTLKTKITDSDKKMLIHANNILSDSLLNKFNLSQPVFKKTIDTVGTATLLKYELELNTEKRLIGKVFSSTHIYPKNELKDMPLYFHSYILGSNFEDLVSSKIKYVRTSEFNVPYDTKRVYKIYNSRNELLGYSFTILKENKIIHTDVLLKNGLKIQTKELYKKIEEI